MHVRKGFAVAVTVGALFCVMSTSSLASRNPHALEQFDRSELRLHAISAARSDGSRFAYFMDPHGYVHHVEVSEYLGKREGRISEISENAVILFEILGPEDNFKEVKVVIELPSR
jgi:Tfp pilus assembly protein PilP